MTREESIKEITNHLNHWKRLKEEKICSEADAENAINAFEVAIKALEQQPSDDCISRAQSIVAMQNKAKMLTNEDTINGLCGAVSILYDMPPATPTRKQSEWYLRGGKFTCKNCEERALLKLTDATGGSKEYSYYTSKFCPNCGAEMDRGGDLK